MSSFSVLEIRGRTVLATGRLPALLFWSAALLLSGCLEPRSGKCGALLCPEGTVCAAQVGRCVFPAQLVLCEGKAAAEACELPGSASAQCLDGICTALVCGDGLLMGEEACDDGNTLSCDGCSSDCRSTEGCGNAIVECNEQCDDGTKNSPNPNAACRVDCRRQRCGDGVVDDLSGEDCDGAPPSTQSCQSEGFYGGSLGCSPACRSDVSTCVGTCGDGEVGGAELCDGNPPPGESCLDFGYDVGNLYCGALCAPSLATCHRMGFSPMRANLAVAPFAIWGMSATDLFAVGIGGSVVRYDGVQWAPMNSGVANSLWGVWGSSSTDVWAVGTLGTILHYDGATWSRQESGVTTQLNFVWGSGPNDVFVVGRGGTILHSDGTAWTNVSVDHDNAILSVWGSGPTDVWATAIDGHIFHYDGQSWTDVPLPLNPADQTSLYAIWGSGPNDIWVVGERGTILHYDATSTWTLIPRSTDLYLNAVDGTGPQDVYVAGDEGIVLHYDGARWTPLASGTDQTLYGLCARQDRVFAVGNGTLLEYRTGTPSVSEVDTGMSGSVAALWGSSDSDVFAAGREGELRRFDGTSWNDMDAGTGAQLWSFWGSGPADVFAVGELGTILHYDGTSWSPMASGSSDLLNWVWGSGPQDVYAAGDNGTLLHFNGVYWAPLTTGVTVSLLSVWGSGPSDVWVVGKLGTILHYDGQGWSSVSAGTDAPFYGVWGAGPTDLFLFADLGGVFHYDGVRWSRHPTNTTHAFDYGSGTGPTDAFVVEYLGQGLFHYDGVDFASVRVPAKTTYSVWSGQRVGYVGMEQGTALRVDRNCAAKETQCSDRWDNDCDGQLNCGDPDCVGDGYCGQGGACGTLRTLACGGRARGTTLGGSPYFSQYGCAKRPQTGREVFHRFVAPSTGEVTVSLLATQALDVLVLGTTPAGACDARGKCLAATGEGEGTRSITFQAEAGSTYYVVVDGAEDARGSFELQVRCP